MNVDFDVPTLNAAARKVHAAGITPTLRVFHRDGCTGIVVDQYGNQPDHTPGRGTTVTANTPRYDFKTKEYERYVGAVLSGRDFTVELQAAVTASARFVHADQPPAPLAGR